MKFTNPILFFISIIVFVSCGKKEVTVNTPIKDSTAITNSNTSERVQTHENTSNKSPEGKTEFKTYCNARFDFCIQYPEILLKQEESEKVDEAKWDGAKFASKDGRLRMNVWGWDNTNIDMQYQTQQEGLDVTYKVKKKSFFVVTGWKKDGTGYYSKTKIIRDNNDNIDHVISFDFIFPREEKPQCAPLIEYIENHF